MTYDVILWKTKRRQCDSDGLIALLLSDEMECKEVARFPKAATIRRLEKAFNAPFEELPFEAHITGQSAWFGLTHGPAGDQQLAAISELACECGFHLYDFQINEPSAEDSAELGRRVANAEGSEDQLVFAEALAAAKAGSKNDMHKVGSCFRYGTGTQQSTADAIYWYHQASEAGLGKANVSLAEVYIQELRDDSSIENGLAVLRKGTQQRHAPSMVFLGELLRDGVGTHPPNLAAAIALWRELLALDPWVATFELARVYEVGNEVLQSTEKAIEYFRAAREAGHPEAYRNLRRLGAEP